MVQSDNATEPYRDRRDAVLDGGGQLLHVVEPAAVTDERDDGRARAAELCAERQRPAAAEGDLGRAGHEAPRPVGRPVVAAVVAELGHVLHEHRVLPLVQDHADRAEERCLQPERC